VQHTCILYRLFIIRWIEAVQYHQLYNCVWRQHGVWTTGKTRALFKIVLCSATSLHRIADRQTPGPALSRFIHSLSSSTNRPGDESLCIQSTDQWRRQVALHAVNGEDDAACRPRARLTSEWMTNGPRRPDCSGGVEATTHRDNWRHNTCDNRACTPSPMMRMRLALSRCSRGAT